MEITSINSKLLARMFLAGAKNLDSKKDWINELNVFPVPDGDTGTNMTMTIMSAAKEVSSLTEPTMAELAKAISSGSLRGARGNSGVILSQLFRGFCKVIKEYDEIDVTILCEACQKAVETAYKAVMKPKEGTILTVAKGAAEKALELSDETEDVVTFVEEVIKQAEYVLDQTPEMLPVLKQAGVVDSGGQGLVQVLKGAYDALIGKEIDYTIEGAPTGAAPAKISAETEAEIKFGYCTEFIIGRNIEDAPDPDELRSYLQTIGDCVVVVNDEEIIKVHVHTEQPGKALTKALLFGQLLTVKVENMKEQHKNAKAAAKPKKETFEPAEPVEDFGFVAVAAGEGLKNLFKDLGCANVVSGGQSMNPSTDDIYAAVMATPAKNVLVFPNNKNIILAAEQTIPMVKDRNVVIVPTRTIPQGMTALLNFDSEISPESNAQLMMDAATGVGTGLVTFAARNSEFGGKKIKEGDIIALENGKLTITEKNPVKAVVKLAKNMVTRDTSFITLIYGNDISEEDAKTAFNELSDKFGSRTDVTLVKGDQPVYYFILSVE